jgi:biopolymer transport protein ExbD
VAVKQVSAEGAVAPNLVPMVDIMFLLLLFFMLGADMGQRELEEVKLPVASSVKSEKPEEIAPSQRLTLNVYHDAAKCSDYESASLCANRAHWSIGIRGEDFREADEARLKAKLVAEAMISREREGLQPAAPGATPISELRVMIRADQAALYQFVQRAMNACGDAGIYKIEVGAASPLE